MSIDDLRNEITTDEIVHEILTERRRQIAQEGWTPEHDEAQHDAGDLAAAAAAYALNAADQLHPYTQGDGCNAEPDFWPFGSADWKPKGARRDLVRAGALIVAEIERLDRAAERESAE